MARNLRGSPLCVAIPLSATAIAPPSASMGIQNRSHYVRDVTFGEDQSRIRSKPAQSLAAQLRPHTARHTTNVRRNYLTPNPQNALSYQIT